MEPHNSGQDTEARIGVDGPASISTVQQLIKLRRFPEAASAASGLVGLQPDNADALLLLGVAQAELRMFAEAELSIRRAISARSSAPWTWSLLLANVLRDAGEPHKAGIEAEALLAREPQRAQIHNALGLALQDQQLHTDALSSFRTAYALDPQYAPAYLNAANTLQQTGQLADAVSEIQSGIDMLPSRQDLALALAKLFDRMGRRAEAKAQYERAISLAPSGSADAYNRLGRLLYADADIYSAIVAFEHALKIDSADVEVWNALGNCYLDVGGLDHASRCFSAALADSPRLRGDLRQSPVVISLQSETQRGSDVRSASRVGNAIRRGGTACDSAFTVRVGAPQGAGGVTVRGVFKRRGRLFSVAAVETSRSDAIRDSLLFRWASQ